MILLITAIKPEADAVLSAFPMKKKDFPSFSLYESESGSLRLLVTGSGKLNGAMAVTAYLTRYTPSADDLFCNFGICGGVSDDFIGNGYLCASLTEATTGKSLYPELYTHPFPEARLLTSDVPVTDVSDYSEVKGTLPLLFDMEAYGIATALFGNVMPSRCFFYKVVSDACNGVFPSPEDVSRLLHPHLNPLLSFLEEKASRLQTETETSAHTQIRIRSLADAITRHYTFSTTMERKLNNLLTYGHSAGIAEQGLFSHIPVPTDSPHKKKEALALLQRLEQYVLSPQKDTFLQVSDVPKKVLRPFRHIYVEESILHHPVTLSLTERFPQSAVIPIRHYKDIFNRSRQDLHAQETEPALILAANHGTKFYPGAPVCQSFGETHFMYTSCIMNCLYDCDYCYLQGMYPSRAVVIFVNLEDYFKELDTLLTKHPVYLCCSYDSDLTALCGILPHAEAFCRYALTHPNLRLELRTKSAALPFIKTLPAAKNIVMAFTVSPQEIITRYEHYTPSLRARLLTAKKAADCGFSLRLCFDPVLDVPNAPEFYSALVDDVFAILQPEEITDISLGVFRLSKDYLKQLKKAKPHCALSHYPYEMTGGVCHYRSERCNELLQAVTDALHRHHIPDEKLFFWTPDESGEGVSYVTE